MRALFVGRFQPFHNGHLMLVRNILAEEDVDSIVIAIGSTQHSHSLENPFTCGERIQMIGSAVFEELYNKDQISPARIFVVPVPDVERNAIWVPHLESYCPAFQVAYTNNPLVQRLFEEAGYPVRSFPLIERKRFWGTEIRRRMLEKEDWSELVPPAVHSVIEKLRIAERIREISQEDII
ncbi:MAG: nicotinamide-nucleotide adenylyltransferase [Candidatus Hodarchaeota archaeon]